jgi:hypothetical protein
MLEVTVVGYTVKVKILKPVKPYCTCSDRLYPIQDILALKDSCGHTLNQRYHDQKHHYVQTQDYWQESTT